MSVERAVELYGEDNFHCSQAVLAAFCDELGLSLEQALKLGACFGSGMCTGEMCGCVTGALMALGLKYGQAEKADLASRKMVNQVCEEYISRFKAAHGSCLCRELLGYDFSLPEERAHILATGLHKRVCPAIVKSAAELLEEMLHKHKQKIQTGESLMKTALLIIDVQNDYFPGGKWELEGALQAADATAALLACFRTAKAPVYFIQHVSKAGSAFFEPDTPGVEIYPGIKPHGAEKVIIKHYPNSFLGTTLQSELQSAGVERLVICGMMTHMCIDTTVRAAKGLGYDCLLISDACAARTLTYDGCTVPADTVQRVYFASLDKQFAAVMPSNKYLEAYCVSPGKAL